MIPVLAVLLSFGIFGHLAAADGTSTGSVSISINQGPTSVPVTVDYSYPPNFDPNKPTIVYIQGGPMPFEINRDPPKLLDAVQVITVNYLGATRNDTKTPNFSTQDILKDFTSDHEAKVIASIVKKEKLQKYILWGQSHGVQLSLRAIDDIQRDPTISIKPIAAVLDSGMGRQVTAADDNAKQLRCKDVSHGKQEGEQSSSSYPNLDQPNIDAYISVCNFKFPSPEYRTVLVNDLKMFSQSNSMLQLLGTDPSPQKIKDTFGCPAFDKINMSTWQTAITCGSFQRDFSISMCVSQAPEQYKPYCNNLPPCYESHLDVAKYKIGKTAILGIQSADDCTNWTDTMDYLMSHLGGAPEAYLKVSHAGGHVTYPRSDAWQSCKDPAIQTKISAALFSGNVDLAKQTLLGCYHDPSDSNSSESAPHSGVAR